MNYLTKWFQKFNANGESDALIANLQRNNAELSKKLNDALDSYNKEAVVSNGYKKANEQLCQEVYSLKESIKNKQKEVDDLGIKLALERTLSIEDELNAKIKDLEKALEESKKRNGKKKEVV